MLKLFEVDNFRGFDSPVVFDLRAGAYGFNVGIVKNGLVKNAVVYGRNGIGKSALGLALFDVISHLTDRETISEGYLRPYCNQNTGRKTARFHFVFDFNGNELEYEYEKADVSDLRREQLFYRGEKLIDYDYADGGVRYVAPGLVGRLNIDLPDNKLSVIKYIYRNTPTNAVRPVTELVEFCERMLWYRCLSNGNDCAGYVSGPEVLDEGIYQSGRLPEFEAFLRDNGIEYRLDFVERDGKHVMVVVFANGERVAFERVASTGTKTLRLFFYWKVRAFQDISFLFVDEFDAFLHFESSVQIIRTLNDTQEFQSVLTSHNTYLMRNDLTRPDCCFIMTKNRVTPLCRATDRVLREGHNLEKMYVNGAFAES